jgi:amino acid transporter
VLGFAHASRGIGTLFDAQRAGGANSTLVGVSLGVVGAQMATAIFAYNGYGAAIYFAEETHDASGKIARAILWALGITVAAEVIPLTAVLLGAPSLTALLHSDQPIQYFVTALGSSGLNRVISAAIAIAIINAVVAITLQAGRTLYGSARDRAYPDAVSKPLAYVHPTLKTPLTSTLLIGLAAAVTASFVSLNALIIATGATSLVLYGLVAGSALLRRRNGTTAHAKYKMPRYPVVPALVIVILLYVAYHTPVPSSWWQHVAKPCQAVSDGSRGFVTRRRANADGRFCGSTPERSMAT